MIYIVSGLMRSGTTMMMGCLQEGGMSLTYTKGPDLWAHKAGKPLYELARCPSCMPVIKLRKREGMFEVGVLTNRNRPCEGFPCVNHFRTYPAEYEGTVMKLMCNNPCVYLNQILPKGPKYKIIYMLRDPVEIERSMESFFKRVAPPLISDAEEYHKHTKEMFKKSPGSKLQVQYRRVIEDPLGWFKFMKAMGWPIDPVAAASFVRKDEVHHKIEEWEQKSKELNKGE